MCYVRIPFLSDSEQGQPLQRCVDSAAQNAGSDVYTVVMAMSHFLEAVAKEMASGEVVSIPGFGLFGSKPIPERHLRMSRDTTPRCKPVFSPCRGLKNEVATCAPINSETVRRLRQHKKNHSDAERAVGARVFTAMEAFRESISKQLAGARD